MDALLSKLTNLGYELFGVFFPGFGMLIGVLAVWIAAGPSLAWLGIPHLTLLEFADVLGHVQDMTFAYPLVGIIIISYTLGQFLKWVSRGGQKEPNSPSSMWIVAAFLKWNVPKANKNYDCRLKPLLFDANTKLFPNDKKEEYLWKKFYTVAKAFLNETAAHTLLPTYQNKYTMHRSLSAASAIVFWACLGLLLISLWSRFSGVIPPAHWQFVVVLLCASALSRYQFWRSYQFNWRLWGDAVITETYMHLIALVDDDKTNS